MVLLYLTYFDDYRRVLRFCSGSVKQGGSFALYELLISDYSPSNSLEHEGFSNNSIPRSMSLIDNILMNHGIQKVAILLGASWLLSSSIQGHSKLIFRIKQKIWAILVSPAVRKDVLTRALSSPLFGVDHLFERGNSDSETFVLYGKI